MIQIVSPTSGGVLTDAGSIGYLDATDSLTAFGLQASTDVQLTAAVAHSFYVASNAAFDIYAQAGAIALTGGLSYTLNSISRTMTIAVSGTDATGANSVTFGADAQNPTTGGGGIINNGTLNTISAVTKVFDGGQKTARQTGTITTQSVRFDNAYSLPTYDLSDGAGTATADVTYTIYVP